jgi:hypothetical protein
MTLKDFLKTPNVQNLLNIRILITDNIFKEYIESGQKIRSKEIYLLGEIMGDWFISNDSPKEKERELYFLPINLHPDVFLEYEVLENDII